MEDTVPYVPYSDDYIASGTYYYRISARNSTGTSVLSNVESVTSNQIIRFESLLDKTNRLSKRILELYHLHWEIVFAQVGFPFQPALLIQDHRRTFG
ncbi:hypothetical protein PAECIP111802_05288 [Paenibacillus allorhizosphaerae]|uniref:Fibronectin type-III domain-containing protein n=1 Tax=Paenibacillus allorhizosphaerae TaxID=2849866 RepID=A0ABM8VPB0_9BACL|nr:hypothetical protein PAECIP111802_05288 [Paenibacillus allorhizosphaerae]